MSIFFCFALQAETLFINQINLMESVSGDLNNDSITSLEINASGITPDQWSALGNNFINVKALHITKMFSVKEMCKNFKNLIELKLYNSRLCLKEVEEIVANLKGLKHLQLQRCGINDAAAELIAIELNNLEYLNLSNIPLKKYDFQYFSNENAITIEGITAISLYSKNLKHFNISACVAEDPFILVIAENLKNLESLDISSSIINNNDLIELANNLKNLKSLNISANDANGETIKSIGNLKNLESLILTANNITDEGIQEITNNHKNLNILSISNNPISKIENIENLNNLEYLDISSTNLDNEALNKLLENLHNLKYLDVQHCRKISNDFFDNNNIKRIFDLFNKFETLIYTNYDGCDVNRYSLTRAQKDKNDFGFVKRCIGDFDVFELPEIL